MSRRRLTRTAATKLLSVTNAAAGRVGLKVIRANVMSEEWFRKVAHFARLVERIGNVEGDVVECGVGAGKSFAVIASLVRSTGRDRCVWGFDPWLPPGPGTAPPTVAFSGARIDEVRLRLRQMGFDELDGIRLVQGELPAALADAPERIALAHVDVLLRETGRECVERLWPKLVAGGILSLGWHVPHSADPVGELLPEAARGEARLEEDPAWHHRRFVVKA